MAEKRTIYQEINKLFGLNAFIGSNRNQVSNEPQIMIKGDSPADVSRKNLELQQRDYLRSKLSKVQQHSFQKAMQYEATRIQAYQDYEGMEFYPIIGAALDLFMEESTCVGENGKMLNIYSNKERIKNQLEDLFYGTIGINTTLPQWTRNLVKNGDNFVYLYGEKDKGIIYVKQLTNFEMEREDKVENNRLNVRFKQKTSTIQFEPIEIAHFRLLGDDKYLPYGSSMLNKIRRVWRQLIMAEDAVLTYRILRAGEKRVFKIPVGNMDENDVEAYIEKVVSRFKKTQEINPSTGHVDFRFNIMGNDEDYFIPVRSENSGTMVDTLPGASNLDSIQDIEYLRDNLFMGLEVPRPFLSYQSAGGEGKNMAQFDVRFAKKVNRIQQALIQELNKIAILHLYYLGYRGEDLTDFKLALTNPSTQSEILKIELLEAKSRVYELLTTTREGNIAATSHTWAKRNVLGWSDQQIIEDFKIQRMERALAQELQDTPLIIKKTGVFDDIDDKYGTGLPPPPDATLGGDNGDQLPGEGSTEKLRPPSGEASGAKFTSPDQLPAAQGQGTTKGEALLRRSESILNEYINLITNHEKTQAATKQLIEDNKKLNENAFKLIDDVDKQIDQANKDASDILFPDYNDEIYESIIKLKDDLLTSKIDELNEEN